MAPGRPPPSFALDGDVCVEGPYPVLRTAGRLVFERINGYWHCHLEHFVHGSGSEQYILNSRDIPFLATNFVESASSGFFSFHHKSGKALIKCWCNPQSADLEDVVLVLQSVSYCRTFEEQKAKFGKFVHECFMKYGQRANSKFVCRSNYPRGRGAGGDSNYWRNNRQNYNKNVDHQVSYKNGHNNYHSKNSPVNYAGDRRQKFYGNHNSENQGKVFNQWTNRDQRHGGRSRGGWRERSLTSDSSCKESPERQQMRSQERTGRSQQPLRDRGSAENSLDRSQESSAARDSTNNAGRSESSSGQKSSSNAVRYGDESEQPEQNQYQRSNKFTNGDRSESPRSFIDSESTPQTPGSENGRDSAWFSNRSRFYSASAPQQMTFYNKASSSVSPVAAYSSFSKRNGHHLSLSPAKKAKFSGIIRRQDKENVEDAIRLRESADIGFKNFGNTCYLNTALQAVFNLDLFASALQETFVRIKSILPPTTVLTAMCELLVATKKCNRWKQGVNFENELSTLHIAVKKEWKGFNVNEMQDSHEFLNRILSSAEETLDGKLPEFHNPIKKYFGFELLRKHTCTKCFNCTVKREPQYDIGVSVSNRVRNESTAGHVRSLQWLLKSTFKEEVIEFKCTKCEHNWCSVESRFSRIPRMLMVHLKRYKSLNGRTMKIDTPVRLPECVTLKDFMSADCTIDFNESIESLPGVICDYSPDVSSNKVDCQPEPLVTCANDDVALNWRDVEPSEDEQINRAISDSLLVDDPQWADEIEKAKELSLRELQQQNVSALLEDEDEDADDENDREVYEDNFQTGHLPHSYRIATVIKHTGSVAQGHYTCLVSDSKENWKVLDDIVVKNISKEDALEMAARHGYVMFYVHTNLLKGPLA